MTIARPDIRSAAPGQAVPAESYFRAGQGN